MSLRRSAIVVITICALASSVSGQDTAKEKQRDEFLRQNFTNFALVKFLQPTNGIETVLQRIGITEHSIGEFAGERYLGIRFTVPEWMDGDFQWMFLHDLKPGVPQVNYQWHIVVKEGEVRGFTNFVRRYLINYPVLQARFPNTPRAIV